jgi:hypothetical protein
LLRHALILPALLLSVAFPVRSLALWPDNGAPLSTAVGDQSLPAVIADGAGGAIVAWHDTRSGNLDIYVQRVNTNGVPQWTAGGVALCVVAGDQGYPVIASDGAGGAIVAWHDGRVAEPDIYAQRVNASGVPQWTANGVAICTAALNQYYPAIVSDGAGGAIIAWQDLRVALIFYDIFAQRINASGVTQWTANGVAVCTASLDQYVTRAVSDGVGGAIITWQDIRNAANLDIYAQRMNASGVPQWTANGVALTVAGAHQQLPAIVADGVGGAVVTWQDARNGNHDIFAQRVNGAGVTQWTVNGVPVCTQTSTQETPAIAADGLGGVVLAWGDYRYGAGATIVMLQRLNATGTPQWYLDGILAAGVGGSAPTKPSITALGAGSVLVCWPDSRNGVADIYAQRFSSAGVREWGYSDTPVCTAGNTQTNPVVVASGTGSVIMAWEDARNGTVDIYAQMVEPRYGHKGHPEPFVTSVEDIAGDQGGAVKLNWTASDEDVYPQSKIVYYSVWRATDPVMATAAIAANPSLRVDAREISAGFARPVLRTERVAETDYYWELVGTQVAQYFAGYTYTTDTRADSTSQSNATHYFQVLSHTADPYVFWPSNVVSGRSVDNLAPPPPILLTAQRAGADVNLRWNRAVAGDLRDYSVYRATSTGVTPVPVNFLLSSDDTLAVDTSAPTSALYYIVTAYDVHENQSTPSNEASVGALTGIGNLPPVTTLTVLDNAPNPFAASTTLRIGLPTASRVEIQLFDVAGRQVRSDRTSTLAAGWREVTFDAHDGDGRVLPSGVYFYRITAAGTTITRKMVIAR